MTKTKNEESSMNDSSESKIEEPKVATNKAISTKIVTSIRDSDSGHGGQTESSSASNSSLDLSRQESEDQVSIESFFLSSFCHLNSYSSFDLQ